MCCCWRRSLWRTPAPPWARQPPRWVLAALGVLNLADGFTMPRYSAEWDAAVQQIEAALTESRSAVTSADPWDSTVAYAFGDPVHCGLLYGVPDGMGIQFDEAAYLTDRPMRFIPATS